MGRDPYVQREDERAAEDDAYARRTAQDRADRQSDHAPTPPLTPLEQAARAVYEDADEVVLPCGCCTAQAVKNSLIEDLGRALGMQE